MQSMSLHAVMSDSSVHLQLCLDIKDFHGSGAAARPGFGGLAFGDQLVNFCSAGSLSGLCDSVNLV